MDSQATAEQPSDVLWCGHDGGAVHVGPQLEVERDPEVRQAQAEQVTRTRRDVDDRAVTLLQHRREELAVEHQGCERVALYGLTLVARRRQA